MIGALEPATGLRQCTGLHDWLCSPASAIACDTRIHYVPLIISFVFSPSVQAIDPSVGRQRTCEQHRNNNGLCDASWQDATTSAKSVRRNLAGFGPWTSCLDPTVGSIAKIDAVGEIRRREGPRSAAGTPGALA